MRPRRRDTHAWRQGLISPPSSHSSPPAAACTFTHPSSSNFQDQFTPLLFVYPGLNALGSLAQSYANNLTAPSSFHLAPGVQPWPVLAQTASTEGVSIYA